MNFFREKFQGTPKYTIWATRKMAEDGVGIAIYYDDYWGSGVRRPDLVEAQEMEFWETIACASDYKIDAYWIDLAVGFSPNGIYTQTFHWDEANDVDRLLNYCIDEWTEA